MSYLTEVNCSSILEAIFNEKKQEKEKDNGIINLIDITGNN
jgi:hypothetical protein